MLSADYWVFRIQAKDYKKLQVTDIGATNLDVGILHPNLDYNMEYGQDYGRCH